MNPISHLRDKCDAAQIAFENSRTKENACLLAEATGAYVEALTANSAAAVKEAHQAQNPKENISGMLTTWKARCFSPWMLIAAGGSSDSPRLLRHLKNDFDYKFDRKNNHYQVLSARPEIEWGNYSFNFELGSLPKGHLYHHEVPRWVGNCCDIIRYKWSSETKRKAALKQLKVLVAPYVTTKQGRKVLRSLKADGKILRTEKNARLISQMEHALIHKGKRVPSSWAFIDMITL